MAFTYLRIETIWGKSETWTRTRPSSVNSIGENLPLWLLLRPSTIFSEGLFCKEQNFKPILTIFMPLSKFLIVLVKYWTNNIVIWSHCTQDGAKTGARWNFKLRERLQCDQCLHLQICIKVLRSKWKDVHLKT